MHTSDYADLDALALAERLRVGDMPVRDAVDAAIDLVALWNPTLNAVIEPLYDEARALAERLDAQPVDARRAPFYGVPFLVKDLELNWAGTRMTRGSRWLAEAQSPPDAPLSQAFRGTGLVAIGKSNTPEFGITGTTEPALFGPCRNPIDPTRIAGGSSGGAAAAVAAGIVPVAHAADGAGSIRIPAACCGLVGLLPSRGRTQSPGPAGDVNHAYARHFIVSRSVRDSAAMLDAVADSSPLAPPLPEHKFQQRRESGPLRIRLAGTRLSGRPFDPEITQALTACASLLEQLGHAVSDDPVPVDYARFYRSFGVIGAAQLAQDLDDYAIETKQPIDEALLEPLTRRNLSYGRSRRGTQVIQALREVKAFTREVDAAFEAFDLLLQPVLGIRVPEIGWLDPSALDPAEHDRRSAVAFPTTPPANGTGQPSISLPLGQDSNGLPIGLMFTARYGRDDLLLQLAYALEETSLWTQSKLEPPPIP
ncbi:MAG: amidase family protein [Pseudomonadota bacterium]